MTITFKRRRIEVLADAPLIRLIVEAAISVGVKGYTLLPTLGGAGSQGTWAEDQITGAQTKILFLAVTSEIKAAAMIEKLSPMLESYGLVLMNSEVEVIRSDKF